MHVFMQLQGSTSRISKWQARTHREFVKLRRLLLHARSKIYCMKFNKIKTIRCFSQKGNQTEKCKRFSFGQNGSTNHRKLVYLIKFVKSTFKFIQFYCLVTSLVIMTYLIDEMVGSKLR